MKDLSVRDNQRREKVLGMVDDGEKPWEEGS